MEKIKKIRLTKVCRILISAAVVCLMAALLLLYRPSYYVPSVIVDDNKISPYLSHILLPEIYNGLQTGESFEIVLTEEGVNDIIVRLGWPKVKGSLSFSVPQVFFKADKIIIASPVKFKGVELMATALIKPGIDQEGLLGLPIKKIKLGAVRFTIAGKSIAKRILNRQMGDVNHSKNDFKQLIIGALFDNEDFEPVFDVEANKKIRVQRIIVEQGKLTIGLTALSE